MWHLRMRNASQEHERVVGFFSYFSMDKFQIRKGQPVCGVKTPIWCGGAECAESAQKTAHICAGAGALLRRHRRRSAPANGALCAAGALCAGRRTFLMATADVIRGGDSIFAATQDDRAGLCQGEDFCAPRRGGSDGIFFERR